jgi:hypothetical protein
VRRSGSSVLTAVLTATLLAAAGVAGYAWNRWVGVVEGDAAVVVSAVGARVLVHLQSRGVEVGPSWQALIFAFPAAIVGYAIEGIPGAILVGVAAWIASRIGHRAGRRKRHPRATGGSQFSG